MTWAEQSAGAYLLRTNCTEKDPAKLWTWYIGLTQAEDCFRISKSNLGLPRLDLELPTAPKIISNVVAKMPAPRD